MTDLALDKAIKNGVLYLYDHQHPNGEFCCYISPDEDMKLAYADSSVFSTSLISNCILDLRTISEVNEILDKASGFLLYQMMRGGVWNNFTILNPLFPLCPPDVDNTACAAVVLKKLNKDYPNHLPLLLANRNKNGLFYTWFTFRPKFNRIKNYWLLSLREIKHPVGSFLFWTKTEASRYDVDAAVNANALYYLGLNEHTDVIVDYMLEVIAQNKEDNCDLWYRNSFTIYYFFSRNYNAGIKRLAPAAKSIILRILETVRPENAFGKSILDTAFGIISLINCGHKSDVIGKAVNYLLSQQDRSGCWPRCAVYYGGPKKLQTYGSEEMTTGFCLEALALYKLHFHTETHSHG